jgi:hypothetical protein
LDYLATRTSLSPIRRGFTPGIVNYKKGCTLLAATNDKVYQLLAHGRWFSLGTPASSTTKIGRHDIAEILLKVVLNTTNQIKSSIDFYIAKKIFELTNYKNKSLRELPLFNIFASCLVSKIYQAMSICTMTLETVCKIYPRP